MEFPQSVHNSLQVKIFKVNLSDRAEPVIYCEGWHSRGHCVSCLVLGHRMWNASQVKQKGHLGGSTNQLVFQLMFCQ